MSDAGAANVEAFAPFVSPPAGGTPDTGPVVGVVDAVIAHCTRSQGMLNEIGSCTDALCSMYISLNQRSCSDAARTMYRSSSIAVANTSIRRIMSCTSFAPCCVILLFVEAAAADEPSESNSQRRHWIDVSTG